MSCAVRKSKSNSDWKFKAWQTAAMDQRERLTSVNHKFDCVKDIYSCPPEMKFAL